MPGWLAQERCSLSCWEVQRSGHLVAKELAGLAAAHRFTQCDRRPIRIGGMMRTSNTSGGPAAAGGFGFQAHLGAIAGVHVLRGTPVQWTASLSAAAPCAVSFETSGPGDDLSLELADSCIVEIQAKKGLRADRRFWSAIDALCDGIHADRCSYGILIVCPNSSISVREKYALALERIGDGRTDDCSREQIKLKSRLAGKGYDPEAICARIRVKTVFALDDAGDAIAAARAELAHICAHDRQVIPAWSALCQDALSAISRRGRRNVHNLSGRLRASQIELEPARKDSPAAISDALLNWTISRTKNYEVLGIPGGLPMDRAWLPLTAQVRDAYIEPASSVEKALADYQAFGEKSSIDQDLIDAKTIGTFRRMCVVVGGPGSGKSLLLKALAREFAKDSLVSVRIRLRDLAKRMQETGCGVEEGLLQLGLDGTGVSPEQMQAASFPEVALLCDGLDECAGRQVDIASGLQDISASNPSYRIIVTTRPIAYSTSELHNWRHYEIAPLAEADTAKHMETLCRCALEGESLERRNELLPRIRSYVEKGSVTRILARSPLLLGFGAALFLNWKQASTSKVELYQRIFRVIEEAPALRETRLEPPAKAIRNRVLNQLGWLTAASPLLEVEELERLCAKMLQRELDVTYLQGRDIVERSLGFWEAKGLIERLSFASVGLIAFIHKSCGEYAAALNPSGMEPAEARETMRSVLSNPDWNEILDFASGTWLATMLAELLIEEFEGVESDDSALNRVFRVLVRPETSLSIADRRSFLEMVFALARSDDRQKAYRVGLCLSKHDLSGIPEAEVLAWNLVSADTEWSQLVGWTVLVCNFSESVHRRALEEAFAHFVECSRARDFFVLRSWKPPFGPMPDRGVFENFLIGAMRLLLADQDTEYQDRLIDGVTKSQSGATVGFVSRLEELLRELGREDGSRAVFRSREWVGSLSFEIPKEFRAGCVALLSKVVPSAFLAEDDVPPLPSTGLKYLAGFFRSANILETPAYDAHVWVSEDVGLEAVHVLIRAAAYVFEVPAERLAAESKVAAAEVDSLQQEGGQKSILGILPRVDATDVDWDRGRDVEIDLHVLEALVHHRSEWVQRLAALFLHVRLECKERRNVCERLLAAGTGNVLYWAAGLTTVLPDGHELLLHRLEGSEADGLHHLFDWLSKEGCELAPSNLNVLENCLLNCGAKTAVSAARWCEATASSADTWLVDLLRSATTYWVENEEPYSKGAGSVPDSPREALLRVTWRIDPPRLEEVAELAGDLRSDVRNAAIEEIVGVAKNLPGVRLRLVEGISQKWFSRRQCEKLLGSGVPYGKEELLLLCDLCRDRDPAFRLLGVQYILGHAEMDPEQAIEEADTMKDDENGNVRDAVHRFLDEAAGIAGRS